MDIVALRSLLRPSIGALKDRGTNADLPRICTELTLPVPAPGGAKRERMLASFDAASDVAIPEVARQFIARYSPAPALRNAIQELLWADLTVPSIPERFRREVARALEPKDLYRSESKFDALLNSLFEIDDEPLAELFGARNDSLRGRIVRHVYRNPGDWTVEDLFENIRAFDCSDQRFCLFLEGLASSDLRPDEGEQRRVVGLINEPLRRCLTELRETGSKRGYPSFTVVALGEGHSTPKRYNLLVTAQRGAWSEYDFVLDASRFLEFTTDATRDSMKALDDVACRELTSLPTLFAYEADLNCDAQVGWIMSIERRGSKIRITFCMDSDVPSIPQDRFQSLAWSLELEGAELNRTHWAVKEVDLLSVLSRAAARPAAPTPPYRTPRNAVVHPPEADGSPGRPLWVASLPDPPIRRCSRQEIRAAVDVVLLVATDVERIAMLRHFRGLEDGDAVRIAHAGSETYYVGRCGAFATALLMCEVGSMKPGAAALSVSDAIREWRPRAVIMAGIAFGRPEKKQRIGDVLVAEQLAIYEPQRVGENETIHRGPTPRANNTLLNRFRNASDWLFRDADGRSCEIRLGEVLSGEKLIDNTKFRTKLFSDFPNAIGGEMEGVGVFAGADRYGLPWLLAKAICDFGSDKRDDDQPLAAASSASLVAHVLADASALDGLPPGTEASQSSPLPAKLPPADETMRWLAGQYATAGFPPHGAWTFSFPAEQMGIAAELRARGAIEMHGLNAGKDTKWRLTDSGQRWVVSNAAPAPAAPSEARSPDEGVAEDLELSLAAYLIPEII